MTGAPLVPVTDRRTPLLLAVYGTLRRGCRNAHVLAGAEPVCDGTVAGTLHEVASPLGERPYSYPLLVLDGSPEDHGDHGDHERGEPVRVRVEVYRVLDPAGLAALDELEAYDPDDPAASEYVRVEVPLLDAGPGAPARVQVYVHAGPPHGRGAVLTGGDWAEHAGERA